MSMWHIKIGTALGTVALTGLVGAGVGVGYYLETKLSSWIFSVLESHSKSAGAMARERAPGNSEPLCR
jgi:hypothetical protein